MPPPSDATIDSIINVLNCRTARDLRQKTCADAILLCQRNFDIFSEIDGRSNMLIISQITGLAEAINIIINGLTDSISDVKVSEDLRQLLRDITGNYILAGGDPTKPIMKARPR